MMSMSSQTVGARHSKQNSISHFEPRHGVLIHSSYMDFHGIAAITHTSYDRTRHSSVYSIRNRGISVSSWQATSVSFCLAMLSFCLWFFALRQPSSTDRDKSVLVSYLYSYSAHVSFLCHGTSCITQCSALHFAHTNRVPSPSCTCPLSHLFPMHHLNPGMASIAAFVASASYFPKSSGSAKALRSSCCRRWSHSGQSI
jgi:hypothetical protein